MKTATIKIKIKTTKAKFGKYSGDIGYKVNKCNDCGIPHIGEVAIHSKKEDSGWNGSFHSCGPDHSYDSYCETGFKRLKTLFRTEKEAIDYIYKKWEIK